MKRGDVYWVNFEPAVGGEIKKRRPAVINSNNASNKHLNRVQVMPFTSNVTNLYPSEVAITLQGKQSKAKADQISTVSKKRLSDNILHSLTDEEMRLVDHAIKIQLGLIAAH
ncbi:MAG: type II toxin-antitoxin system PemK/MazF family toxin [Cyclobacteriaceae bacterium]